MIVPDYKCKSLIQECLQNIEDIFQKEWSKQKFKWFFKKYRQRKLKTKIFRHYSSQIFCTIEDAIEDALLKEIESSISGMTNVKDIALGDKNYFNYQIEELDRTLTYLNTLPPPVKYIKVKSKFYKQLAKMHPSTSSSEVEGIRAKLTGIPIVIDDEIEGDYEPVYGEEN